MAEDGQASQEELSHTAQLDVRKNVRGPSCAGSETAFGAIRPRPCTRQNYSETRFTAKKAPKPSLQHVLRHPIKPAVALGDYRRGKPAGPASRAGTSTCRNHGARTNRDGRTRGIPESVLVVQPYLAHPSAGAQLALEGVSPICHPSVGGAVPNRRTIVQMRERFPNKYGNQAVVQYATSL